MSILSCMNIAQQALVINEAALSVVSNNIANVDTDGYSRQRVVMTPSVNYSAIGNSVENQVNSSSGVDLLRVERYTDTYMQAYFRQQTSDESYLNESSNIAADIEDTMNELDGTGLEAAFSAFYEAAQTLSLYPADSSARQNYVEQAQTVALKFNNIASSFTDISTSLVGNGSQTSLDSSKISGAITDVNAKIEQLTKINSDIIRVGSSDLTPNSLLDQRDAIIDELSKLIPVSVTENTNGTINLSLNGIDLITGPVMNAKLGVETKAGSVPPVVVQLLDADGNVKIQNISSSIDSGSVGAMLDMCGPSIDKSLTVPGVLKELDDLAKGFAGIINDLQTKADTSGTPMAMNNGTKTLIASTENIFESNGGGAITAGNIQINSKVLNNPYLVATARVDPLDYEDTAIGNNSNMIKVIESRTANSGSLANSSPEGYVANMVSSFGLKVSTINNDLKSQTAVLTQVGTKLASATGVNLNEELMDITKYQTAYQASARVYSVCNDLLDTLINLGR